MRVRVVAPSELTPRDVAAWQECAANAVEPNPFLEPGWLLPALEHLDESPRAALVVAEHGGCVHACVPLFEAARRPATSGSPSRSVLNTRVAHTAVPVGTPFVSADRGSEALELVLAEVARVASARGAELVVLEWLVADGRAAALLGEVTAEMGLHLLPFESWERGFLRRIPGEEEYWARSIGSNRRRTIRQHRRRLEEDLGSEVTTRVATDAESLDTFVRLEMSGWKGHDPGGLALGRDPGAAAFFRTAGRAYLDRGRLGFLCLDGPDGPIAMICLVRAGEGLFAYRTAYDERYARHGPGVLAFLAAMEHFDRETDAAWLDTCAAPGNEHLLGLFPDRRPLATFVARVRGGS
ncbi:MAG: GNAT family N-acetyltransferase [Actinomycetota bacterium]|nr:GNAT family N-acetyltransferase [Actinomycetota bacterium]